MNTSTGPPQDGRNTDEMDTQYDQIIEWYIYHLPNAVVVLDSGEVRVNVQHLPIISLPPVQCEYHHLEPIFDFITQYYNDHMVGLHAATGDTPISGDYELPRLTPPLREYSPQHHTYCMYLEDYFRQLSEYGLWLEEQQSLVTSPRVARPTRPAVRHASRPAPSSVVTAGGDNNQNRSNSPCTSKSADSE